MKSMKLHLENEDGDVEVASLTFYAGGCEDCMKETNGLMCYFEGEIPKECPLGAKNIVEIEQVD